jgi:hypothetical protein
MKFTTFVYGLKAAAFSATFLFLISPAVAQEDGINSIEEVIVTFSKS